MFYVNFTNGQQRMVNGTANNKNAFSKHHRKCKIYYIKHTFIGVYMFQMIVIMCLASESGCKTIQHSLSYPCVVYWVIANCNSSTVRCIQRHCLWGGLVLLQEVTFHSSFAQREHERKNADFYDPYILQYLKFILTHNLIL